MQRWEVSLKLEKTPFHTGVKIGRKPGGFGHTEKQQKNYLHTFCTYRAGRIERPPRCAGVPLPPVALSIEEEGGVGGLLRGQALPARSREGEYR